MADTKRNYEVVNGKHHRPAGEDDYGNSLTKCYRKGDIVSLTASEAESWGLFDGQVGNVRLAS